MYVFADHIDHGQPPATCNLFYNRDCTEGGCIVSAIANQTKRVLSHPFQKCLGPDRAPFQNLRRMRGACEGWRAHGWLRPQVLVRAQMVRRPLTGIQITPKVLLYCRLAHFLGDITQPLHASGAAIGGNAYPVTFNNKTTELHAVRPSKTAILLKIPTDDCLERSGMGTSSTASPT